jgi:aminoglycoside phosphotransferase (APT) family kinase protein
MATVGHPLSDITNLMTPHTQAVQPGAEKNPRLNRAFLPNSRAPGIPTKKQCLEWYAEVSGYNPESDIGWGDAFGVYRNTIIIQGIAARYAMGVASSASAKEYAVQMNPFAETCWRMIQKYKSEVEGKANL